jgi:hypothetical protein
MSCSVVNPVSFPIKALSYFGSGPMANRMMFVVEALAVCHAGRVKRVCIDQNNSGLSPNIPTVNGWNRPIPIPCWNGPSGC